MVVGPSRCPLHLNNQVVVQQAFENGVERARAEPFGAVSAFGDILDDGVAMTIGVRQRDENVKDGRR